jgi:hypothetical protein
MKSVVLLQTSKILNIKDVAIFWNTAPFCPYVKLRFGGTYHVHLQDRRNNAIEENGPMTADPLLG